MRVRKVSRLHQDLTGIILRAVDVARISDIEYFIEFGTQDLDHFLGGVHKVTLRGTRDGAPVKIRLVIKWHSDPAERSRFRRSYRREHAFYQRAAPRLLELQRRHRVIEGLKLKVLHCVLASVEDDKETLVVYTCNGYKFLDRFRTMDFAHSLLVMKNLAKLHALSFALRVTSPDEFKSLLEHFEEDVQYSDVKSIPACLTSYFRSSINVIRNSEAKKKLESISPKIPALLNRSSAPAAYSAICHGDCWNNNITFKYQGTRPVDVLFVDYQLARYASPATDISYYLYMSTERDLLAQHYHRLVGAYYGTLTAVLRQCGLDVDDVYPKRVFDEHLRDYSVLGLIEAMISMKIITAETEEAMKMAKMKHHCEEPCQYESQNKNLYENRVNDVVADFFERNYSLDAILKQ